MLEQTALLSWRVARAVMGWLHGYPDWRVHPRPSSGPGWLAVIAISMPRRSATSRRRWLHRQFAQLVREIADLRAITSSPTINDSLSRQQPALAALHLAWRPLQGPTRAPVRTQAELPQPATAPFLGEPRTEWPFLSL